MTYPVTITENYILLTSDEEIKEGDTYIQAYGVSSNSVIGDYNLFTTLIGTNAKIVKNHCRKVLAHLPISKDNSDILYGVPLLPPLPNEDDVEKLVNKYVQELIECKSVKESERTWISAICHQSITKAKERYRYTEDDMKKAYEAGGNSREDDINGDGETPFEEYIQSISKPKMPTHFKVEMETSRVPYGDDGWKTIETGYKIINGVMQGEWIFN